MKKQQQSIGSVCLYGSQQYGFGYLAGPNASPAQFGSGNGSQSASEAVWKAMDEMAAAGHVGPIEVYASGGKSMAIVNNADPVPWFGDFKWGPAKVWVISVDAIKQAAAEQVAAGG